MTKRQMQRVREIAKNITLMMIVVIMFCWCSWYETHYTREATVIDVTETSLQLLIDVITHGHSKKMVLMQMIKLS